MIEKFGFGLMATLIVALISAIPAWITHVIVAINAFATGVDVPLGYGILLAFEIWVPPIGVIHGWGIWFCFW